MKKILSALFVFSFLLSAGQALATGAPTVVSTNVSNITSTSATFNGVVNPNGGNTYASFLTSAGNGGPYGQQNLGSGTSNVTMLPYTITGLTPNTTYQVKIFASNPFGTTVGSWAYFTTTSGGGSGCNTCGTPAATVNLTANPSSVQYGGSSTLAWNSTNATSCNATGGTNGWSGPKSTSGTFYTGNLTNSTTYTITCTGAGGSGSDSVTVYVASQPYNPPPVQYPSVNLTANPSSIQYNGTSTISWTSTNATSCNATGGTNGWSGPKPTSGTFYTGNLTNTVTYTITCSNSAGSASDSATVYVAAQPYNPPSAPSVNLTANPSSVQYGGSSTLAWNSTNATSCNATGGTNGWSGPKSTSGTFYTGNLTNSTTYTITCTGAGGSATDYVTVSVGNQPQQNQPTVNLTAAQTYVTSGQATTLSWTSTFATSCNATGGVNGWSGPKNTSGTFNTGALSTNTTFTITCTNSYGSASDSVTIYIQNQGDQNAPTINFYATNLSLAFNGSTTLYWSTTGATSCTATNGANGWAGPKATSGSFFTGNLTSTTIFTLTCSNTYGSTTASVTVTVGNQNNNDNDLEVTTNAATNISTNSATLNGELEEGDEADVWFEYSDDRDDLDDDDCRGDCEETNDDEVDEGDDFSERISGLRSNTTYYFRAVARNNSGTDFGSIRSFRTDGAGGGDNICSNGLCQPQAITTLATNIGNTSARLNGLALINGGSTVTSGYFEWGSTPSLGNTSPSTIVGTVESNPFSFSLFGLSSNSTYYYRAVATNQYGISRGDIVSFRTTGGSVAGSSTTVIRNVSTTTVVGGTARPSLVFLSISHNDETIRKGEIVEYVVNYRNISQKNLRDVVLQVALPKELQFVETSRGYFSETNNTVVVNIGDLFPNEEGTVFVSARVLPTAEEGKIIVVTANLAYTIVADNTQEEVFAYSKNTIADGVVLGASALFGTSFWPNSLFGWLCLLLLLLLILLIARMAYNNGRRPQHQTIVMPPAAPNAPSTVHHTTTHRDTLL